MPEALNPTLAAPAAAAPSLAQFDTLPASAHVRLPVVVALIGASPATVWRWVKAGRLPEPVKLGPNVTAWRVGELRQALAGQPTAQPAAETEPTTKPAATRSAAAALSSWQAAITG